MKWFYFLKKGYIFDVHLVICVFGYNFRCVPDDWHIYVIFGIVHLYIYEDIGNEETGISEADCGRGLGNVRNGAI